MPLARKIELPKTVRRVACKSVTQIEYVALPWPIAGTEIQLLGRALVAVVLPTGVERPVVGDLTGNHRKNVGRLAVPGRASQGYALRAKKIALPESEANAFDSVRSVEQAASRRYGDLVSIGDTISANERVLREICAKPKSISEVEKLGIWL